jgi:hypothetical protein
MKFVVGDIVDFYDTVRKTTHRGMVVDHAPGRDVHAKEFKRFPREYLVKFDNLWLGYNSGWIAVNELTLVRSTKTPSLKINNQTSSEKDNIKVTAQTDSQPWLAYYMTADDFFDILRVAFNDTYGDKNNHKWHPEDLYINVSCVLEIVSNTLANSALLKSNKELRGVKEI